jgi:hypothetical protein
MSFEGDGTDKRYFFPELYGLQSHRSQEVKTVNKLPKEFVDQERVGGLAPGDAAWIDPLTAMVDLESNMYLDPDTPTSRRESPKFSMFVSHGGEDPTMWIVTVVKHSDRHHWKGRVLDQKIKWIRVSHIEIK